MEFNVRCDSINYPKELNQIIIKFCGNIFFSFDMIHDKYRACLHNNGTIIKPAFETKQPFNICASEPFTSGINTFKVKYLGRSDNVKFISESIGIISDTAELIAESYLWCKQAKADVYYYLGAGGIAKGYHNKKDLGGYSWLPLPDKSWKVGDIISIQIDCIHWKFTVFLNDQQIGSVDITPNLPYYAFMSIKSNHSEFHVVY